MTGANLLSPDDRRKRSRSALRPLFAEETLS